MMATLVELMGCAPSSISCPDDEDGAHFIALKHVRQSYTWDCGLACVMMVLDHMGISCTLVRCLAKDIPLACLEILSAWLQHARQLACICAAVTHRLTTASL